MVGEGWFRKKKEWKMFGNGAVIPINKIRDQKKSEIIRNLETENRKQETG